MTSPHAITSDTIRQALALSDFDVGSAHALMSPVRRSPVRPNDKSGDPRLAAVLVLVYPVDHVLHLVLIRRNSYEGVHSDQVGLPGGRQEDNETFMETALRETSEELGVDTADIEIAGKLTPIYIPPSDFFVHPFVGFIDRHPVWQPDPREVADIIETPLHVLLDETLKGRNVVDVQGARIKVPYYDIQGNQCWGATAIMLAEFEGRIRAVLYS